MSVSAKADNDLEGAAWHHGMVAAYYEAEAFSQVTGHPHYFRSNVDPRPHAEGSCRCVLRGYISVTDQQLDAERNRAWCDAGYPIPLEFDRQAALLKAGVIRPHGKYLTSKPKRRGCIQGYSAHTYRAGQAGRCGRCSDDREALHCWSFNCGSHADYEYTRAVDVIPNPYREAEWTNPRRQMVTDYGTCEWCIEKYRRADERAQILTTRAIKEGQYIAAVRRRDDERAAKRKEGEIRWQAARATRMEARRQREKLREGRQTLAAIRRHLQGRDPLPRTGSRPARTSPTS